MSISREAKAREVAERIGRAKGHQPRAVGSGYLTRCSAPGHDDPDPDLRVDPGTRNADVVIRCHSRGCHVNDILAGAGMTQADLHIDPLEPRHLNSRVVAEYNYRNAAGESVFVVRRMRPTPEQVAAGTTKTFSQGRYDSAGRWTYGLNGLLPEQRPPYLLPELIARQPTVAWLAEGEKDVHTLIGLGVAATTNAGGATGWGPAQTAMLPRSITQVVICADNDEEGHKRAYRLLAAFQQRGMPVLIQVPPKGHKDISDLVAAGGGLADLVPLTPDEDPQAAAEEVEQEDEEESLAPVLEAVLPFPATLMPQPLAALLSKRGSMPAEMLAGFALASASACLPGARLVIDEHIIERAADWFAVIAPQAYGKSGARRVACGRLEELEKETNRAYGVACRQYYAAGSKPKAERVQNEPPDKVLTLTNFTTEAMVKAMASGDATNTSTYAKSALVDELVNVVRNWGRYSSGSSNALSSDRSFWLELWDGNGINQRRVSSPPIIIPYAYACLAGGIQPARLHELGDDSDGMVGRFLPFGLPPSTPQANYSDKALRSWHWDEAIEALYRNAMSPRDWTFDAKGADRYSQLCRSYQQQARELSSFTAALAGKMSRHLGRLVLILSEITDATNLASRLASTSTTRTVPMEAIEAAAGVAAYCMSYWSSQVMFSSVDDSFARRSVNSQLSQLFDLLRDEGGGATSRTVMRRRKYDRRSFDRLIDEFRAQGGQVIHIRYTQRNNRTVLLVLPGVDPEPLVPDTAEIITPKEAS